MTLPLITVLLVEDNPVDALVMRRMIEQLNEPDAAWRIIGADCLAQGLAVIGQHALNAILLDLNLPDSRRYDTFSAVQKAAPAIPVIICTSVDDVALALRAVHDGAQDYLVKGAIQGQLLARSIRYAIERKRMAQEREQMIGELKEALAHVRTLSGLLPICAACKKIRDDKGYWHQVEQYISEHTDASFSHGICPDCARRMYPGVFEEKPPG